MILFTVNWTEVLLFFGFGRSMFIVQNFDLVQFSSVHELSNWIERRSNFIQFNKTDDHTWYLEGGVNWTTPKQSYLTWSWQT